MILPTQISAAHYPYGYRYAPYSIPQTATPNESHLPYPSSVFKTDFQTDLTLQNRTSPLSSVSLSPTGSDKLNRSLEEQLQHYKYSQYAHPENYNGKATIVKSDKQKLFKPYKPYE